MDIIPLLVVLVVHLVVVLHQLVQSYHNPSPDPNHPQPQGNAGGHGGSMAVVVPVMVEMLQDHFQRITGYGGKALQVAIADHQLSQDLQEHRDYLKVGMLAAAAVLVLMKHFQILREELVVEEMIALEPLHMVVEEMVLLVDHQQFHETR